LHGGEKQRNKYGDVIYGAYRAMVEANPKVDVLVCGDFNDEPSDESIVKHLRATGDRQAVLKSGGEPLLYNLLAGKDAKQFGTHYSGHWLIFDQIMVSPGLLGAEGWSCDVASVHPFKLLTKPGDKLGRPWKFGGPNNEGPRGYSDHFPMTVQLRVQGK
jgi:endonuclease/exonuclease/phosphatase family metal-dependent hydrolase